MTNQAANESPHARYTELDMIQLLREIVRKQEPEARILAPTSQVDLLFDRGGQFYIVEVKKNPPQTRRRLHLLRDQLLRYSVSIKREHPGVPVKLVLAIDGIYTPDKVDELGTSGIELWDRNWILAAARRVGLGARAEQFFDDTQKPPSRFDHVSQLQSALKSIPPGKQSAAIYQKVCAEIFELLFCPPLDPPNSEIPNESGVNRRDFVMANYADDRFWAFLRNHYRADYVVVEAKNLTGVAGKEHVLQLCNYLTHHGLGLFGILITRRGSNRSAGIIRREQWVLHNKLTVVLSDDDVMQMLENYVVYDDPALVIRQKIGDFRIRI